jgi:hypothetical protein
VGLARTEAPGLNSLHDSRKPAGAGSAGAVTLSCSQWASVIKFNILQSARGLPCSQTLAAPS